MKKMKNLLATITLVAILMVSFSTVEAGILMTDDLKTSEPQPCVDSKDESTKIDSEILVTFTGILVTLTGIIVTGKSDDQTNCGILVTIK